MLSDIFWKKLKLEMRLYHIIDKRPRINIKLDPLSEEDYSLSLDVIQSWSKDNKLLFQQILENGMAEFICNREYLFEFYQQLLFPNLNILDIDSEALRLINLRTLNLSMNRISCLRNIPPNCKQLFIDFNQLTAFEISKGHPLQLLSISHNGLNDDSFKQISSSFTELRCLNVSHNKICLLKDFVNYAQQLRFLKILVAFDNPLSMLAIYYSYITDHLFLSFFDGKKYVKEQSPKKVVDLPPVVPEKKEEKEEKKQTGKKDSKKSAQPQPKVSSEPVKIERPPTPKKQLSQRDFERVNIQVQITNLQQVKGNTYDASLFPPNTDPLKIQSCFWVKYELFGECCQLKDKKVGIESAVTDGSEVRLDISCRIQKEISVSASSLSLFNSGLRVEIHQSEPKMIKDADTLETKPCLQDNQVVLTQSILGGCYIDFRDLHILPKKELKYKFKLFPAQAISNPLFYDPFEDEPKQINQRKQKFEQQLKAIEEEALKKMQEEELLLQQKKGKDQKKAPDKKGGKKEGKDNIPSDKNQCQRCSYPLFDRLYSVVDGGKMFKGKQVLCLSLKIS